MKVVCIRNVIDDPFALRIGLEEGAPRNYRSVTPGTEYVVLGLIYKPSLSSYAGKPVVEVRNDAGGLSSLPLFLFDITDHSASKYWKVRFNEDGCLALLPESFYSEYFHDDLSEGVPEVRKNFDEVCQCLENER